MRVDELAQIRRRPSSSERGQMMTFFALVLTTFILLAIISIVVGQTMIRRHQAQIIVDAAALAGAQQQAKGLNTIARINEKALYILNGICYFQVSYGFLRQYEDSESTTNRRLYGWDVTNDWAGDRFRELRNVFRRLDQSIDAVNLAYSPLGHPRVAAERVIRDNFHDDDSLFHDETPRRHGILIAPELMGGSTRLVRLTDASSYKVGGLRQYRSNSHHNVNRCCCDPPYCFSGFDCCYEQFAEGIVYGITNFLRWIQAFGNYPTYRLGRFYDNDRGNDVRFTYYLEIEGTQPIFGRNMLADIPPITVVASAKPYGGYLGTGYKDRGGIGNFVRWGYDQRSGKEISYTYKAMLVPVTTRDKRALALWLGENPLGKRWVSVLH